MSILKGAHIALKYYTWQEDSWGKLHLEKMLKKQLLVTKQYANVTRMRPSKNSTHCSNCCNWTKRPATRWAQGADTHPVRGLVPSALHLPE